MKTEQEQPMDAKVLEQEPTRIEVPEPSFSKRDVPAVSQVAPTNLMQALAIAAADPRMDVAKVKELYAIHKEMMDREAELAFSDAMAKAQAEMQPVANNAYNDHTKSGYAKLEAIDRAITPIHTKYGLSMSYDTETRNDADPVPDGMLRIVAWVRHSGGHKERHHIDLPPDDAGAQGKVNKTGVQARGSSNAYGRRYLKLMAFNLSTFDDKDGNSSRNNGTRMEEKILADYLAAIDGAGDEPELLKTFGQAWNKAEDLKDKDAQRQLINARDLCRKKLK
ncbi:MAG: ERF family protein, partial [Candidatus Nanopelagicales bacterium]|nr:ERF family protein [Candidatus Nanopelagicales bacterium]